jgi:hypothetical protein
VKRQALSEIKIARSERNLRFLGAGDKNPETLSQIKECGNNARSTLLRSNGRATMLVQIDSNPRLAAIWHFGELMCIPVAVVLTLTALMI